MEHAYSVARYGNEFEILKIQTKTIQSQTKDFIQEVESIFNRHLDQCKDQIEGIGKDFKEVLPNEAKCVEYNDESPLFDQLKEQLIN